MPDEEATPSTHMEETVTFHEASEAVVAETPTAIDTSYAISGDGDVGLGEFLARPVKIKTFDWVPTAPFTHNFNPWVEFLQNSLVADKWRHYAYLKGNLHLKVVINGSPFYYGRSIMGYLPLDQANEPFNMLGFNLKTNERYSDECRVNYLSQCQSAYLDPSTSSSIEMELPFICPRNAMRMFKPNSNVSAPAFADLVDVFEMGRVHFHEINPLRQGNTPEAGVEARVTVNIFAWMENAELSVPTDQRIDVPSTFKIAPQGKKTKVNMMTGKKEEQEAVQGTVAVSSIASAFEDSLSRLGAVPVIGPFATAGSIAAGAMSRVAKIFGFSSPVQLADTQYYQPEPLPKFASTVGAYLGAKLSVDPLNEVVIDPRVGNFCPEDQLSIENFAGHESYLTSFEWAKRTNQAENNILFRCAVTPSLYSISGMVDQGAGTSGRLMQPTSLAFASCPFDYWRGTLKVRFQVVASQYHRGRIAIVYEPNIHRQDSLLAPTNVEYNGRKVQVFDLQEFDGTEIEFPWAQSEMFCQVAQPETLENSLNVNYAYSPSYNNAGGYLFSQVVLEAEEANYANGFFEVVIINDLTGAIPDPPPIDINVYVSMPDLVVASPTLGTVGNASVVQPSFALKPEAERVTGDFDHNAGTLTSMIPEKTMDQALAINFGENIRSFRLLLKRHQGLLTFTPGAAQTDSSLFFNMYPLNNRYVDAPTVTNVTFRNRNITNLFEYLRGAFVGMRGGFRYSFWAFEGADNMAGLSSSRFSSTESNPTTYGGEGVTYPDHRGVHTAVQSSNPAINIEVPYYEVARFVSAQGRTPKPSKIFPYKDSAQRIKMTAYSNEQAVKLALAAAPADDFTFIGRVGAPPIINRWTI